MGSNPTPSATIVYAGRGVCLAPPDFCAQIVPVGYILNGRLNLREWGREDG